MGNNTTKKGSLFIAWTVCFVGIPFLSFWGRPVQAFIFFFLSPLHVTMLSTVFFIGILVFIICQSTREYTVTVMWEFICIILAFVLICMILQQIERVHVVLFGVFGFLSYKLFEPKVALLLVLSISGLDELLQHFLSDRVGDWRDVITNAISSVLGLRLSYLFFNPNITK